MKDKRTENAFETEIVKQMVESKNWVEGKAEKYDRQRCLYIQDLTDFVKLTQYEEWQKLTVATGGDPTTSFVQDVSTAIMQRGTLDVLRNPFDILGCRFQLIYFIPASSRNEELVKKFQSNILTVVRQLKYSSKNEKSIDLVLFINGMPIFTAELKNQFTKQDVDDAVRQYKTNRLPKGEPFLQFGRCLAHFAVDLKNVKMCTHLNGAKSRFLPFDKGNAGGAGNPYQTITNSYPTDYLWRNTWSKITILNLLQHFMLHEPVKDKPKRGKSKKLGTLIFPRYHQLHAVNSLIEMARNDGSGHKYLIQHSAGSGKSNTIAWLSHRLSQLQDNKDERVFNAIIIITDRRILNNQLQHTIQSYEKTRGLVETITEGASQLEKALKQGKQIIVTTLQTFPHVLGNVGKLKDKRFALVIDEAHSSQGGSLQQKVTKLLTSSGEEEYETYEDLIASEMAARGHPDNMSVFAFTATPKSKTIELFGKQKADGTFGPHSIYSMRQAIEEGFILDVLKNYTTYKVLWKLNKDAVEDPDVESPKAKAILRKFVKEDELTVSKKVDLLMSHFTQQSMHCINGKAKAMVVTSSRKQAVQFRKAIDSWILENKFEFKALVAFTGTVSLNGDEYTEHQMNGVNEKQTRKEFEKDDFKLLVVADKYQTGFDQPLLHTMYVDKKLGGVAAVQTLSRLNRINPGKTETCVIDFANEAQDIQDAFQPYYEETKIDEQTNPQVIYSLKREILDFNLYSETHAEEFCKILFDEKATHANVVVYLNPLVDLYNNQLDADEKNSFRKLMQAYVRGYAFLSRVITFSDQRLEEFFQFCRFIVTLLTVEKSELPLHIKDLVLLDSIGIKHTSEGDIPLERGSGKLHPRSIGGPASAAEEELEPLSRIISTLNERHGAQLTEDDRVMVGSLLTELTEDESLTRAFEVNPPETVKGIFTDRITEKILDKLSSHQDFVAKYMNEPPFQNDLMTMIFEQVVLNNSISEEDRVTNLISQGESSIAEFKATLRWNIKTNSKDKSMTYQCLKAVAGFLNSPYGGTLYIGVNDDTSINGIEKDSFEDPDKAILYLTDKIETSLTGGIYVANIKMRPITLEDKVIIMVEVPPATTSPVYCKGPTKRDGPVLYVREGTSTRIFTDQKAEGYIMERFGIGESE